MQLPRFLLDRSYSLRDVLQTLDIAQVFQDDADISNMGGAKGPKLTQVSLLHAHVFSQIISQNFVSHKDDIIFRYDVLARVLITVK